MFASLILAAAVSSAPAERVVDSSGEIRCSPATRRCPPIRIVRSGREAAAETPAETPSWRQDRLDMVVVVEPGRRRRR